MKILASLFCANLLFFNAALAQSQVTLAVDARSSGYAVPEDFCGLSFGAVSELPGKGGVSGLLFSPTNSQLITLFTNSGIRNLRLGGSTVEGLDGAHPSRKAIDDVFGFAKATGIKVIYSLPLLNGNAGDDADTAKYIWKNYRSSLSYFAIANEPDIKRYHYPPFGSGTDPTITNYESFLVQWSAFATAVTNAVPEAKFAGPDAASAGRDGQGWAPRFARDEKDSGRVGLVTQHFYVGGSPYPDENDKSKLIPVSEAIDKMLSPDWVAKKYPSLYTNTLLPILNEGMPYRMTESNDYLKGVPHASDAFASALWGLDYLHWWAAHGASGVNFHNTEWLKTDTVYYDSDSRSYLINPKAYAIRAFDSGSHGNVKTIAIDKEKKFNLTAYAIGDATNLYVTVINKEHGANARAAVIKIAVNHFTPGRVEVMSLLAPEDNPGAMDGITLGGSSIVNNDAWRGQWTPLKPDKDGCMVTVSPTSAMVVKISAQ